MFVIAPAQGPMYSTCNGTPTSSSFSLDCMMSAMNISEEQLHTSNESNSQEATCCKSKMRRCAFSVSRRANVDRMADEEGFECSVEARQIEIGFVSIAQKAFAVRVRAPNKEESEFLEFPEYGRQCYFLPKKPGCGHGHWYFDMYVLNDKGYHMMYSQNVYLDGVGSLVFTIGDDLEARLSSQEFLHLPSACRCFRPKKSVH